MKNSINALNAILSTAYTVKNANLNVLIGTLVTIISVLSVIQSALIVMALFLINALVVHLRNFFSNNSVFLPVLMATI